MHIGYDPDFLGGGIRVPMPTFNRRLAQSVLRKPGILRNDLYSDHTHFSLVMNEHSRQLIYSAYNIDQTKFIEKPEGKGKRGWRKDPDIGSEFQLGNEYYKDRNAPDGTKIRNLYDRGHMVMRFNNMWGDTAAEADKAGKDTFIYANSSLQHENLNRDEWKELELEIVRTLPNTVNQKLAVFTGPIFGHLDRHVNLTDNDTARVPGGFFKIICFRLKDAAPGDELGVLAFAIYQDTLIIQDKKGASKVKTDRRYQVTISELQDLTGLNFGKQLYERNPLFYHDVTERNERLNVHDLPERIPINTVTNIVRETEEVRIDRHDLATRGVAINSAMIDPVGPEPEGEWVSIHNRAGKVVDLEGWFLFDGKGRFARLTGMVEPGHSLRLDGTAKGNIRLSNQGGSLMLYDNQMSVIDHVTWSRHDLARVGEGIAYMFERGQ
ncbi:DNA/RNA non-specific endonuclease [Hyphomonas sp. FCG-A18]|jgi:endonuclease G|uniref:DNA/RNA non-specific endonuclease n=1 Tax=Hyphomonas sp. FCG-A18 TaxID=3080019 RepID=UPI002B281C22|nr:DNA/RNA non-specific endonuclease [Hyphomonas sp. FCG-A18]